MIMPVTGGGNPSSVARRPRSVPCRPAPNIRTPMPRSSGHVVVIVLRGTAPTVCASRAQISKRMIYPKNLCARALPCMATRNLSIESLVASLLPAAGAASADIRLPRVVGDNMVLQRDAPLKLWGWADPGERVQIRFRDQKISTTADPSGAWSVTLTPLRAGGPSQSRPHDRGETTSFGYPPRESNSVDQDGDDWDAEAGPGPFVSNHVDDVHVRFFGRTAVAQGSESWAQKS